MDDRQHGFVNDVTGPSLAMMRALRWSLPALPALLTLMISTCWDYRTPGVYMDAVNPDYLVVGAIDNINSLYGWVLPGTMLFGKFPTIIQLYHGALPFYVGLPFYALFGTGLIGIRLVNAIFAVLVLLSIYVALKKLRVRASIIALALTCLALDPGFIFSFRTQFYINLLPISLVMLSITFNIESRKSNRLFFIFGSGLASGLAMYGYFIYAFFTPALFLHAVLSSRRKVWSSLLWLVGLSIGCLPYALGYGLIIFTVGGLVQFRDLVIQNLASLQIDTPLITLGALISFYKNMLLGTILSFGPSLMMLHKPAVSSFPYFKVFALTLPTVMYTGLALVRRSHHAPIYVIAGLLAGTGLLFLTFKTRLWFHHAIPALPLMYVGLTLTAEGLLLACSRAKSLRAGVNLTIFSLLSFLLVTNLLDRHAMFEALEQTGGVGLASDAIVHFAEDNVGQTVPTKAFFPDWGVFMPFEMITNGTMAVVTDFSVDAATKTLCSGTDVLLGAIEGKSTAQIEDWKAAIRWGEPSVKVYDQKDGTPVLTAVRWSTQTQDHAPCP